ncbi:MAG: apbE 3 [Bryobacterales bacterium]|nr:apbE 3 [Bryobacterales bacterium]
MLIGRRSFLAVPFLGATASNKPQYRLQRENVLGTSMELRVASPAGPEAETAALAEIARLCKVVSTYDAASEISRLRVGGACSAELGRVLSAYSYWEQRTGGAISARPLGDALNVDALGKAFVMEKALAAGRKHAGSALLNIGGDLVAAGGDTWNIDVADPARWHENAAPLTSISIRDMAVATSGVSERGAHIRDPRTGRPAGGAVSATVIARDTVAANALSTALCVLEPGEGLRLTGSVAGAECLMVLRDGTTVRSAGFRAYERARAIPVAAATDWTPGYDLSITLTLKPASSFARRPYVAVWAEDERGKVVRNIAVWANKPRWMPELHTWWADNRNNDVNSVTRATRPTGRYRLVWDGLDDKFRPVPAGTYTIFVESNREHGNYAKESGKISCGTAKTARATLNETSEFEAVALEYGPRGQSA